MRPRERGLKRASASALRESACWLRASHVVVARARERNRGSCQGREKERDNNRERERERVDRALEIDNVDDVATMSGAVYRHILSFSSSAFFRRGVRSAECNWDWDCPSGLNSIKARQPTATILTDTDTLESVRCVCVCKCEIYLPLCISRGCLTNTSTNTNTDTNTDT